jgi:hypothetical protein
MFWDTVPPIEVKTFIATKHKASIITLRDGFHMIAFDVLNAKELMQKL